MNVNVLMDALGMGIVRLVRSTIEKMGLVLIAGKPGMRAARNNWFFCKNIEELYLLRYCNNIGFLENN
jgi:hypothetical protein